jgi:hypothetical protein
MPGKNESENPIKLRVHVSDELYQKLVQMCGLQTLEEGRLVTMSELLRGLLAKGVNQGICQSLKCKSIPSKASVLASAGGGIE